MKMVMLRLMLLAGIVLAGVTGCGQKGPLYFPEEESQKQEESKISLPLADLL